MSFFFFHFSQKGDEFRRMSTISIDQQLIVDYSAREWVVEKEEEEEEEEEEEAERLWVADAKFKNRFPERWRGWNLKKKNI